MFSGFGEAFRAGLVDIPWAEAFLPSKILVAAVDGEGNVVAVCGIRSALNILTLYVCERFRSRGIGSRILEKAIDMARERRLSFVLLGVFYDNVAAFHLYSKLGFEEVVYLKKTELRIMMLPLDVLGTLACTFLRGVTSLLPNLFWSYAAQWVHSLTVQHQSVSPFKTEG